MHQGLHLIAILMGEHFLVQELAEKESQIDMLVILTENKESKLIFSLQKCMSGNKALPLRMKTIGKD